jgi:hypothetical protein
MTSVHYKALQKDRQRLQIVAGALGRLVIRRPDLRSFSAREVSSAITGEEWALAWTPGQALEAETWIQRLGRRMLSHAPLRSSIDGVAMNLSYRRGYFIFEGLT